MTFITIEDKTIEHKGSRLRVILRGAKKRKEEELNGKIEIVGSLSDKI